MSYSSPVLKHRFTDANGLPLAGGKLYTYRAGTTTPRATYTDSTSATPNTNPIILDANGECDIYFSTGTFKFVLTDAADVEIFTRDGISQPAGSGSGGSLPSGGLANAVLYKVTGTDQDADWEVMDFSGYSARYGTNLTLSGLTAIINYIFNFVYTAPTISLSASGSGTIREKGTAVTSSTLTATITKKSDPIATVRFYENTSTLIDTQTSGGAIPSGGTSTYAWTGSFSDNYTFKAEVDDNGATGGPTTVSSTSSFTFVYPYYSDAGASGKTGAQIGALTKTLITSTATVTKTMTATAGQVFYFAYPAAYGALTSILDVNNFETITDWTFTTKSITGLDATAQSYYCYEFNNPVTAGSYQYTFKR